MKYRKIKKFENFTDKFTTICNMYPKTNAIVEIGGTKISYKELYDYISRIAKHLVVANVKKNEIVGLYIEKSIDYIAAMLACWKVGAAFLPIDPTLPKNRIKYLLSDSNISLCVASSPAVKLEGEKDLSYIYLSEMLNDESFSLYISSRKADDLAYLMYSSGSTGEPKGILVNHSGIVNLVEEQAKSFKIAPGSKSLFMLSINFDAAISDICVALFSGATLYIERDNSVLSPMKLSELILSNEITHIDLPPSYLAVLNPEILSKYLKTVVIGGEAALPEIVRNWAKYVRVINVYGPTEATVCSSLCECDKDSWNKALLGKPLSNIEYRIWDLEKDSFEQKGEGELWISGIALARGYHNKPELNQSKFVLVKNKRWYRTGDKVRITSNGEYEYLGRIDRMFKLNGKLIEPQEIEFVISSCKGVKAVAVIKRKRSAENKNFCLVAYIEKTQLFRVSEYRKSLNENLPEWMQPKIIEYVKEMPRNVSGKIDYLQLEGLKISETVKDFSDSRNAKCKKCQKLLLTMKKVLGNESLNIESNFFDNGGDSFAVLEFVFELEKLGIVVTPASFYKTPSVRALCGNHDLNVRANSDFMNSSELVACVSKELNELEIKIRNNDCIKEEVATSYLFTGASGYLGSAVLLEVLNNTRNENSTIYCLVRGENENICRQKILKAIGQHSSMIPENFYRVKALPADLSQDLFGLTSDVWNRIAKEVTYIYHFASEVNMLKSFSQLYSSNVLSMKNILEFALTGSRKELHFASTLSVFVASDCNTGVLKEDDNLSLVSKVYGGYAQSKWVAETLLRSVSSEKLKRSIYRFGLITGDSATGKSAKGDFLCLFLKGIKELAIAPIEAMLKQVDITPIDYASKAMYVLSKYKTENKVSCYHIANSRGATLREIVAALRESSLEVSMLDYDDWKRKLSESSKDSFTLSATNLSLCSASSKNANFEAQRTFDLFQATNVRFCRKDANKILQKKKVLCPEVSVELLSKYVKAANI